MATFPSAEWFDEVRKAFNGDDVFHGAGGGACSTVMGAKIGKRQFLLTFEGLECSAAREVPEQDLATADFYLDMSYSDWRAMIENIAKNGRADLHHTLNTLDLGRAEGLARSVHGDQYREDLFFRYNQTMQFYFDASARVKTQFAE